MKQDHVGHGRFADRQGAGLVEDHRIDLFRGLEGRAVFHQHPQLRPPAGSDHDRCRCRQSHRAGTGDDENGDKIAQAFGKGCLAEKIPDQAGDDGQNDDRRHKVQADRVGKRGNRRLRALGLLHHPDDPGKGRILPRLFGPDMQDPVFIDGPAEDPVALLFIDRHTLAAEHGLVNGRLPVGNGAIRRDPFSRPDQQQIARFDLGGRHGSLTAIFQQGGGVGRQFHELDDGVRCRSNAMRARNPRGACAESYLCWPAPVLEDHAHRLAQAARLPACPRRRPAGGAALFQRGDVVQESDR